MKKIFAIACTAILAVAMLTSTAFAGSFAPVYWDLEIELRKADSAKVVKDGIIGEGEYEKLEFDNDQMWINWNSEKATQEDYDFEKIYNLARTVGNDAEFYFSWDEVHGLNMAVKYKPVGWENEFTTAFGGEAFLCTPGGGLLFQAYSKADITGADSGNILYAALGQNSATKENVTCVYQKGFLDNYEVKDEDVCIAYDAETGYVVYEWSIPLAQVAKDTSVGSEFYFGLSINGGEGTADQGWGTMGKEAWNVNLQQWGFFMSQPVTGALGKATVAKISDVAVGYVEPEPTPTPVPTEEPKATEEPKTEEGGVDTWMIVAIIGWVVAIALAAVVVLKKKK